jgi:hypothetical protein
MEDITKIFDKELIEYIEQISKNYISKDNLFDTTITDSDFEKILSKEYLIECMKKPNLYFNCKEKNKCNLGSLANVSPIIMRLMKLYPDYNISQSGDFLYNKDNGLMGWHTNADALYERIYFTYSETGDSFFRYYDYETDSIITSYDNKGVTIRKFNVDLGNGKYLWHCVGSKCYRTSFGFRMVKKYV